MPYTTNDARIEELFERFVPPSGKCDTLNGEMVRAIGRIRYDYLNNGFGNNWTGALNFLDQELDLPRKAHAALADYANCRTARDTPTMYQFGVDPILLAIEKIENIVIKAIGDMGVDGLMPPPCDMFDLQEKDDWRNDEEE
jgi:hypothetical protein